MNLVRNLENRLIGSEYRTKQLEGIKLEEEANRMKQTHAYKLDLTKIEGEGDFTCPKCGTSMSPDDCSEKIYAILETKYSQFGLEELVIRCCNCTSQIHLTGFSLLRELAETEKA